MREEHEKTYPNCFKASLEDSEDKNINIVFAKAKFDSEGHIDKNKDIDILSNVNINKEGLKVVLRGLLNVAEDYNKRYNINILDELIDDFEEVGEENVISRK